jgi:hypothetical protein
MSRAEALTHHLARPVEPNDAAVERVRADEIHHDVGEVERLATNTVVMAYQDTDVAARYADQR